MNTVGEKKQSDAPVLAYFYPLTTSCAAREARASQHGIDAPVDETELCQQAAPLYEGHRRQSHIA